MRRIVMTLLVVMAVSPLAVMAQELTENHGGLGNSVLQRVDSYPGQPGYPNPGDPTNPGSPTNPGPLPPTGPTQPNPNPGNPAYMTAFQLYDQGMAAYRVRDYRTSSYFLRTLVDRFPYDFRAPDAAYFGADSYKQLSDFSSAADLYRRVVRQYPTFNKCEEAYYFVGFCLVKLTDYYGAISEFQAFLGRYPRGPLSDNAWFVLGKVYELVSDRQNAIYAYRKVVYEFPNSDTYAEAKERLWALEQGAPPQPPYPTPNPPYPPQPPAPPVPPSQLSDRELYDRGHSELVMGNFENAVTYFSQLLRMYPTSALADDAALWKGKVYLEWRQYSRAASEFTSFKRSFAYSEFLFEAIYSLGWAQYQVARLEPGKRSYFQKAASQFTEFVSRYGGHQWAPEAMFLTGECYEFFGDANAARFHYEETIRRYPGTPSAQKAQEKLNGMY